jgi:broad specificity phosphatase PhoE
MAKIYLVRHGKAAAGFDGHHDPGLDATGRAQAEATARDLAPVGPLALYSSPLARARETAEPLAAHWDSDIIIEPRVAEIPSPTEDLAARAAWLRRMQGRWRELDRDLRAASAARPDADALHYVAKRRGGRRPGRQTTPRSPCSTMAVRGRTVN